VIRHISTSELPSIRQLLGRANDAPYDLEKVAEEKCFGAGIEGQPQVRVFGDLEGISVTCGKYLRILAVDRERRGRGIGTALLRDAESRGAIVVAAEAGNYFTPGVSETVARFLLKRGYVETARTQNLVTTTMAAEGGGATCASVGPAPSPARKRVLDFIERHFGTIWRFEAMRAASLFYIEEHGEIAGFSTHEANNRGLGVFGPTGVAKTHRGGGLGHVLLRASLADLRRLGYHRAIIPWTEAIEYYQKGCGARIDHRFVILRRKNA